MMLPSVCLIDVGPGLVGGVDAPLQARQDELLEMPRRHERRVLVGVVVAEDDHVHARPGPSAAWPGCRGSSVISISSWTSLGLSIMSMRNCAVPRRKAGLKKASRQMAVIAFFPLYRATISGMVPSTSGGLGIGRGVGLEVLGPLDRPFDRGRRALGAERPDHAPLVAEQPLLLVDVLDVFPAPRAAVLADVVHPQPVVELVVVAAGQQGLHHAAGRSRTRSRAPGPVGGVPGQR